MAWFLRNRKNVFYSLFIPIFIFGLAAALPGCKDQPLKAVELEFWGAFDDSDIWQELIGQFNQKYPKTQIKYYKKTYADYEKDLLEAMATGRGPDIFMIHHTWLTRYSDRIVTAPEDQITFKDVQDNFVDVVLDDFALNGSIGALPLGVDTLALYYNKDILNTVGIPQPPSTWEEFIEDVEKITQKDERGNIIRAGAALGTARNINRSTDILSLLMIQSGVEMVSDQRDRAVFDQSTDYQGERYSGGQRSLEFYTDFANPLKAVYTWNNRMHYSIDAFYEGKVAMMFNYSYHIPTIRAKAPYLNFGIAPMPQIKTSTSDVNYANYWGLTVSRNSKDSERAWQFITWLSQKENHQKYLELSGKPSARRDLIISQKTDPDLGVFAQQALSARSWYQADSLAIEQVLADMIESVVVGGSIIAEAIQKAAGQITLLMR
ncbi:MAG: extracellular solute-binding protein [Candidatus Portnoybacteria bacterium]